jgi:predicted TIM-barrel fold metal-dependent hydrolase
LREAALLQIPGIIDAHAVLGQEYPYSLDRDELLRRMDASGVELAVARPMGAELTVHNRAGNRRVASAGPRIRGWATANPWFGAAAVDELKRARDEGAVGLYLHPSRQGFMPIEPIVEPLLRFAAGVKWPVMFHTGTYVQSDVLAVGEVARRFPGTQFVAGWAGFTDMWFELPGVFASVPNLWLDMGMIWCDATVQMARDHGPARLLFSGGEPRNRYPVVLRALERQSLPEAHVAAILRDNARRLFGLTS